MESYLFVRNARTRQQSQDDDIHFLCASSKQTVCGQYEREELTAVRSLGPLVDDANVCSDCELPMDNVL